MKAIAVIITLLILTSIVRGQDMYQIFKVSQGVTISKMSALEVPTERRMEIKMGDLLHIPAGGEVAILEKNTKQIYTYRASKGEDVKVAKILINAKKQASNNIAAINRELASSINEKKLPGYDYTVHGVTLRSICNAADINTLFVHSALCRAIEENIIAKEIGLERINSGEHFHFKVSNNGNTPVYFNIIRLGETPHICIPTDDSNNTPCLILNAQGTWNLEQIQFVYEEDDKYLLFVSDVPFNSQILQQMFNKFNKKQIVSSSTKYTVSIATIHEE